MKTPAAGRRSSAAEAPAVRLLRDIPDLPAELERLLAQVPISCVTTYGDLARALGDVAAARWVGEYLLMHPHRADCRCHRVVRVTGDVGLYIDRTAGRKAELLRAEGIEIDGNRVDLDRFGYREFRTHSPLGTLGALQRLIPEQLRLVPLEREPRRVGGVDVSYISPTEAVAAFVLIEVPSLEVVWSTSVRAAAVFPYISGYLSFRELPVLLELVRRVRAAGMLPDVTFVDGNGILHPRRAGSASCFGLAAGIPTIGVGKKLLCGQIAAVDGAGADAVPIIEDARVIGCAMSAGAGRRPFYVSPGHLIDLPTTRAVTERVLGRHRLPLPIVLADRESRREAARAKSGDLTARV